MKKTKSEIKASIKELAEMCLDVATDADYFGGMDADCIRASRVLISGSAALVMLADSMEVAE